MLKSLLAIIFLAGVASGQTPVIFFSDLESGPNIGGENNNGAYVTIYGTNFGSTQGTSFVTVGGGRAVNYKLWGSPHLSYQKVTFQLGPNATSGNIVLTTSAGPSNGIPFGVRTGSIYFVSQAGNDASSGAFASPWRTIVKAKNTMRAGDISYIMDGVNQTTIDGYSAALSIGSGGSAGMPIALVAYAGATVTIGSRSLNLGLRTPAISGSKDYWTIAGMRLTANTAVDLVNVTNWRIVGNDFSCPSGGGQTSCLHTDTTTFSKVLGNYEHGSGAAPTDKYYHRFYFTTNSNNLEVAWNEITGGSANRGIQFYSTGGQDQFGLSVHDNYVHDVVGDGINFATVNASQGTVEAYNNLIVRAGTGPDPSNGASNYACLLIGGASAGTVQIYNNTLYDCGANGGSDAGLIAAFVPTALRNNIVYAVNGERYLTNSSAGSSSSLSGSNNIWFGNGVGPARTTGNINADPKFVDINSRNFRLQSTSPAINAGVPTNVAYDRDGTRRPQGSSIDIGAYEYGQGGSPGPTYSECDLNKDNSVNATDVADARNQALGRDACTADLDNNGRCDVIDVQRVINASLGSTCRVGP